MARKKKNNISWFVGFIVFSILLILDILIPDPLPLVDEIILFLLTALFGGLSLKKRKKK